MINPTIKFKAISMRGYCSDMKAFDQAKVSYLGLNQLFSWSQLAPYLWVKSVICMHLGRPHWEGHVNLNDPRLILVIIIIIIFFINYLMETDLKM